MAQAAPEQSTPQPGDAIRRLSPKTKQHYIRDVRKGFEILDLITQMIHAAPVAADDGIDRAVLTKGFHQLDERVALHAGKTNRHPLDRIRDLGADGKGCKNRPEDKTPPSGALPRMKNRDRVQRFGDIAITCAELKALFKAGDEVFDETVDIGGGVPHVVKAHRADSGLVDATG